jgi:hypothetical protein
MCCIQCMPGLTRSLEAATPGKASGRMTVCYEIAWRTRVPQQGRRDVCADSIRLKSSWSHSTAHLLQNKAALLV